MPFDYFFQANRKKLGKKIRKVFTWGLPWIGGEKKKNFFFGVYTLCMQLAFIRTSYVVVVIIRGFGRIKQSKHEFM